MKTKGEKKAKWK